MGLIRRNDISGGVPKPPREKTGFMKYATIYFNHFWKLMALNFIYLLFCIPVVTIGPATAAITKVCRNYSQERHAYVFGDFWDSFKKNFKQGIVFGLLDLMFLAIFAVGIPFYREWAHKMPIMYVPMMISLVFMLIVVMMNFYAYLMVSSTNLTIKQIIKNSFILSYLGFKKTLICLVVYVLFMSINILFFPVSIVFAATLSFSFIAFLDAGLCYPLVRKYIIQPYYDQRGEENPEDALLDTDADRLFKDMPEYETPEQKKAKKAKKKTVK